MTGPRPLPDWERDELRRELAGSAAKGCAHGTLLTIAVAVAIYAAWRGLR